MSHFWVRYEGTRFPIRHGETVVGRSAYCTIVVSDPSVSREHVAIKTVAGQVELTDLGSHNGTFVNGERVTGSRILASGDVIRLGSALLEFLGEGHTPGPRRSPSTGGLPVPPGEEDPCASTATNMRSVAQIEALVWRAMEGNRPPELVDAIRVGIETATRSRVSPDEARRLRDLAGFIATWYPDGSLDRWKDEISRRLLGE